MGTLILSLDSVRKEGPATHHGSIHSLVGFNERGGFIPPPGFNEKGGPTTHHGSIHFLIGLNEMGGFILPLDSMRKEGPYPPWEHSFAHWIQ